MVNMVTFLYNDNYGHSCTKMIAIRLKDGNSIKTTEGWNEMMETIENKDKSVNSETICILNITSLEE